jgi:molybdenum cofactor cytidylyltransferase
MTNGNGVYGIILASGLSVRMGKTKLLMPWRGKPLLEYVLTTANGIPFDGMIAIIPDNFVFQQIASKYPIHIVVNGNSTDGMGFSLSLGVHSLPSSAQAVVIMLGDQPQLKGMDVLEVLNLFNRKRADNQISNGIIIRTKYMDGKVGHPVLFSRDFFPLLQDLRGDIGGKEIIQKHLQSLVTYESPNPYPNDIDTPEDYQQLIEK